MGDQKNVLLHRQRIKTRTRFGGICRRKKKRTAEGRIILFLGKLIPLKLKLGKKAGKEMGGLSLWGSQVKILRRFF